MVKFNLYGPINDLGYGIFTKGVIQGFVEAQESNFYLHPIGGTIQVSDPNEQQIFKSFAEKELWNRSVPAVAIWHEFDLDKFSAKKLIAYPIFETNGFSPKAVNYLKQMDAVCVLSNWAKEVVISAIGNDVPVHVVPGASDDLTLTEEQAAQVHKPKAFTFINMGKYEKRKGHIDLIQAYLQAFAGRDVETRLIVHCYNPFDNQFAVRMTAILQKMGLQFAPTTLGGSIIAVQGNAIIEIPKARLTKEEMGCLLHTADAGVFPSRAEGWNLPLMETIKAGIPCVATNYSAHTEYLNDTYNYPSELLLNDLTEEVAQDDVFFYGDRGNWMSPNITEIAEKMSYIHNNYEKIKEGFDPSKIKETFTWKNTALKLKEVIDSV